MAIRTNPLGGGAKGRAGGLGGGRLGRLGVSLTNDAADRLAGEARGVADLLLLNARVGRGDDQRQHLSAPVPVRGLSAAERARRHAKVIEFPGHAAKYDAQPGGLGRLPIGVACRCLIAMPIHVAYSTCLTRWRHDKGRRVFNLLTCTDGAEPMARSYARDAPAKAVA